MDTDPQTVVEPEDVPELGFVDAGADDLPVAGDEPLRVGLVGSPNFDPAEISETDASAMLLADLLYDGLTESDPVDGTIVPALAEHWLVSQDGLAWTFILRSEASFHDGTPITSEAVKASIERVRARGAAGVSSAALEVVIDIEVVDERTLTLRLSEPFAALRDLLASPVLGIVAPDGPFDAWSGSYGVVAEDRTSIRFEATAAASGAVDSFHVEIYKSAEDASAALAAGDVDIAPVAPGQTARVLEGANSIVSDALGASIFYGMNVGHPALENPLFRAAIVRAVDNGSVANLRTEANVVAATDVAGVDCNDACAYDVDFARELLDVAYPDGQYPVVPIDYYTDEAGTEEALALEVARQLDVVGIETELRGVEFDAYAATVTAGDHGLFRFGAVRGYASPVAELRAYTSSSPLNVTGFANAEFDAAVALAAEGEPTAQVLAAEILANASVVVPLVRYQSVFGVAPRVEGLELNAYGTFDIDRLVVDGA